jgi:riboflavin synthase
MFTGLIEELGTVVDVRRLGTSNGALSTRITIEAHGIPSRLATGDSVAVSGVCLTALEIGDRRFSADLAQETLQRTSLGHLAGGSIVNLELPARAGDPIGGHIVQGHVDGTGKLLSLEPVQGGEDWRLALEIPPQLARYVIPQGSITVEGISLTVAGIEDNRVEIAIIPHTYQVTNLRTLRPGDPVNIETDALAKYAEKMAQAKSANQLTVADLIRQGF